MPASALLALDTLGRCGTNRIICIGAVSPKEAKTSMGGVIALYQQFRQKNFDSVNGSMTNFFGLSRLWTEAQNNESLIRMHSICRLL